MFKGKNKYFVTGDTHGIEGIFRRLSYEGWPESSELDPSGKNYVIILGDCGLLWNPSDLRRHVKKLDKWLENKPFEIMFLMGNHENYDLYEEFELTYSNEIKGYVRTIGEHITALETSEIYTFNDKMVGVFGGASSVDKMFRTEGKTWWPQEIPKHKMEIFMDNLADRDWKIDCLLTHTTFADCIPYFVGSGDVKDEVAIYLQFMLDHFNLEFKHHYHGHMHNNMSLHFANSTCVYKKVIPLGCRFTESGNPNSTYLECI